MRINKEKVTITNQITANDFVSLRESAGFQALSIEQAELVIEKTTYISVALYDGVPIGMARLLFDFCTDAYITDVIVAPEMQGCGIGALVINDLVEFLKRHRTKDTKIACSFYANKGKEGFYEHFGFEKLPNEKYGFGMIMEL